MSASPLLVGVGCGHLLAALGGACPVCGALPAPLARAVLEARAPVHVDHQAREAHARPANGEHVDPLLRVEPAITIGDLEKLIAQPIETPQRVISGADLGVRALGGDNTKIDRPEVRGEDLQPDAISDREVRAVHAAGDLKVAHGGEHLTESALVSSANDQRLTELPAATATDILGAARAKLAFRYLRHFVRLAFPVMQPGVPFEDGPHIDAICDHVQWQLEERARTLVDAVGSNPCENLLINIPPRCLKSTIVAVAAVAWAWLHWPHLKVLALSTNPRVSNRDGDGCLKLIRSQWYCELRAFGVIHMGAPAWNIRSDRDGSTMFENTLGGTRTARGLDGAVTGEGGDWIIIDDPHDARDSADVMIKLCEDYDKAIHNRTNSPRSSIRTCVMQRLAVIDFSAHVLRAGWTHLCLPAEYVPERACATRMPANDNNRYPAGVTTRSVNLDGINPVAVARTWRDWREQKGDTLHARMTPEFLAAEKKRLGSIGYAGQMQQTPVARDGGIFKLPWIRFFTIAGTVPGPHARPEGCNPLEAIEVDPKSFDWITISVDCTFGKLKTSKKERDNVGLVVMAGRGADRFVLMDRTRKMDIVETMAAIKALCEAYPRAKRKLIEKKANGEAILTMLGPKIPGLIAIEPEGGKASRAYSCTALVEAGNFYVLEGADWTRDYVEELCAFTGDESAGHDDRVDATTQCLVYYGESRTAERNRQLGQL